MNSVYRIRDDGAMTVDSDALERSQSVQLQRKAASLLVESVNASKGAAAMTFEEWWAANGRDLGFSGEPTVAWEAWHAAWEAATAAERERCAKVCENVDLFRGDHLKNSDPRVTCADAIRAR